MKKIFILLLLFCTLFYLLIHPTASAHAAADGLLLWYQNILPVLLPMAILSNLMIRTDLIRYVTALLYPVSHIIYPTSRNGCFALLGGLLFGFPMGSKLCSDLVCTKKISHEEGEILSASCNLLSPMFLFGFVYPVLLQRLCSPVFFAAALYLPPLLTGYLRLRRLPSVNTEKPSFTRFSHSEKEISPNARKRPLGPFLHVLSENTASGIQINLKMIDECILNGCETLVKLGCYIMFFSILASLLRTLLAGYPLLHLLITGITEITTGLHLLSAVHMPDGMRLYAALCFCSFGGFCAFAQTCSFTNESGFSPWKYLLYHVLYSGETVLLIFIYEQLHGIF